MATCVVITGLIRYDYINPLLTTYRNYPNKIISTWNNQDINLISLLQQQGFIIVQDNYPEVCNTTNYQSRAILNGCKKAQELGYKYIIRMRTDIDCNDFNLFSNMLNEKYLNNSTKLVSFAGIETPCSGIYFYDVMIAGNTNSMLVLFKSEQSEKDTRYVEKYILETYAGKQNLSRAEVRDIFNFCYLECRHYGLRFNFPKKGFEIIQQYCNEGFIWI